MIRPALFQRLALLAVLAAACPVLAVPAPPATFVSPAGSSLFVRATDAEGRTFVSVGDIATVLGGTLSHDAASGSYELKIGPHTAVFGTETAIAVVDTRLVQLASPVRGEGASAFADADFFTRVLSPLFGVTFVWDRAARTLVARRVETPEIGVEATVSAFEGTTKVVFRFTQSPSFKVEKGDDQVVLRFPGLRLVPAVPEMAVDDPRVARLFLRPNELAVVLKGKDLSTNVYPLASPPRLVVDVTRAAPAPPASTAPAPGPGAAPGALVVPTPAPRREPRVVVIDPGHGGTEEGAKGPAGLLEKDVVLALARTVREVLTARGYRVVTTRDSDASVGLQDRTALSNAAKADVFLSLHMNAARASSAHGTEVYYLSLDASDRSAAALADSENRAEPAATPSAETNAALRDLDLILWDLAQNQHLSASSRLAEIIQGDFNRLLGIATRGVKQAPFRVLIGVNAPAVLVEVAFISNPEEEQKAASEEFRKAVAETLAGSLDNFFRASTSGAAPVPTPPPPAGPR
ncbi:MAG: N-acetylmuramoyl-L-alanine amidase [Holophagales bacterium]|nr:N-acetylmuramoyl-L-alanine amidase [Holophagales bacterium]MBK9964873.1 N-acetylmuramoyl-L-alanine amidase [Holophagales bacterium]